MPFVTDISGNGVFEAANSEKLLRGKETGYLTRFHLRGNILLPPNGSCRQSTLMISGWSDGTNAFVQKTIKQLEAVFIIGSRKPLPQRYFGIDIGSDTQGCRIAQHAYLNDLKELSFTTQRRDATTSDAEKSQIRTGYLANIQTKACALVAWKSRQLRRIARSTLAAETWPSLMGPTVASSFQECLDVAYIKELLSTDDMKFS